MYKPKVLLYDLETAPSKGYYFDPYRENNIVKKLESGYILCWCAKWLDGKQITKGLCDYKGYKPNSTNDKELVKELYELINEADIVIAHNGDRFDIKKMNTQFIKYELSPPDPYKTIDTLKVARKNFAFESNKLDALGEFLGVGRKVKHEGIDLWIACMNGDLQAWGRMKKYNKQDVVLLEAVYKKLLPWITNHPTPKDGLTNCPNCHSDHYQKKGDEWSRGFKYKRAKCQNCGTNFALKE